VNTVPVHGRQSIDGPNRTGYGWQEGHGMLGRFVFLFLLATSRAMAGQAAMGDVSVNLPPPAGFCDLLHSNPVDAHMLSAFEGLFAQSGGKLLGLSADCGQLAGFRVGQRPLLDDYAFYLAGLATIGKAPVKTIKETCDSLRAETGESLSNVMQDAKARLESALEKVKINQMAILGVLAEEPRACYAGLVQQARTQVGTDKTVLNLYATTIVRNRTVLLYRYGLYTGPESVSKALAKLKDDVAALYAAN
jgi:hypothetical protein